MSTNFHEVERQASALPANERAALARKLIADLDLAVDADAEQLWLPKRSVGMMHI